MDRLVKIFTDGASRGNPGPASIGIFITDGNDKEIKRISEYIGTTTNNIAEYRALLRALEECKKSGFKSVEFFTDSQLLANQIKKLYKISNEGLKSLYVKLMSGLMNLSYWNITHIPREKNKIADSLANQALDKRKG
ncbi:ribonuclease HI family protein [candidate division WOR-3 bacterium]|nr:ribonuclease HI family protein [candidate division WOR-3 bacterium]MCK4527481.1 ribonuclease HI family protein [candidate division WOR-3 bacterium]